MTTQAEKDFFDFIQKRVKNNYNYKGTKVYNVSTEDVGKLKSLCDKWGLPFEWMCNLMSHESAGTFNPAIVNSLGYTGLIQFGKDTAIGLGTTTAALAKLSFQGQLEWVDKYLASWKSTWKNRGITTNDKANDKFTQQDLFMTIFTPAAIGKPDYKFSAATSAANNGIKTPADYTTKALSNPPFPLNLVPSTLPEYRKKFPIDGSQPVTPDAVTDEKAAEDESAKIAADKQAVANKSAKEGRLVNSKIILKKVSGPGEIVGVTELDLELGSVIFKGLQFTEGGDYVVSVSGSSTQIVPTEFSITVAAAEEVLEQEASGQEEPISGTRPIIAQIDQPTKKLDPMTNTQPADNQPGEAITGTLGNLPFVYYSGNQIRPVDIQKLSIYYDQFVPKCMITFGDSLGLVNAPDTAPTSNSTIEIFLDSGSEQLKSVHLKFLIDQKKDNKNGTITIYGKLDLKEFYKVGFESLSGSSFDVLREVSKKLQLGYNSNITQTNDAMNWVRNGVNSETFIREIINNSYISDDSFMVAYIDYYYCFNYVDVEKEYNRDNSTDVAINSTGLGGKADLPDEDKTSQLFLSNSKGLNSSPYHFSKFTFMNNSTAKITNKGSTTDSKVYDRVNKRFLNFKVDSMASTDPTLKTLRSEDDIDTNFSTEFSGKLDTDNVHENYLYALSQNQRNLTNLGNIMADLTLPIPNFNIYKFQKIRIVFVNDKSTPTEPDKIITRYTGNWIIIDISFVYQKGELFQNLRVARKELSKTQAEIDTEVTKPDNSQNSELNENPVLDPEPVIPNSIYEVGQEVYLEQNGRMYIVKIDRVSENGLEVSGKIQQSTIGVPFGYQTITPGLSASTITPIVMTPSVASNAVDAEIKAVATSTFGIYSGQGNEIITATVPFLINDGSKEFIGIGTASLSQAGGVVVAQKEVAFKLAEIDAIKKYKAG